MILRLPKSSDITTHVKPLHWLSVKVRSTCKIACLCYHCHNNTAKSYVTDMCCRKSRHTTATFAPAQTLCLFSMDLHSGRKHLVIDRFILLLLVSGTQIQNDVRCAYHCRHLSLIGDILISFNLYIEALFRSHKAGAPPSRLARILTDAQGHSGDWITAYPIVRLGPDWTTKPCGSVLHFGSASMSALHTRVDVGLLSNQAAFIHLHTVSVLVDFLDTPRSTTS